MTRLRNPFVALAAVLGAVALLVGGWYWFVERTEVGPGEYLVVISLWGKDLPEGEIVAPDKSYKGIHAEPLPEGRHWINPLFYSVERWPIVKVDAGKCLVLTRKFGPPITDGRLERGDYLADKDERGVVAEVLGPGNYRLNKYAYSWELVDAVQIGEKQVGVKTLKAGKDVAQLKGERRAAVTLLVGGLYCFVERTLDGTPYVVREGYRGVQEKTLPPGTHYLNPYVASVVPVDVSSHPVEFTDIRFPSRDGFTIQPHVTITYHVLAENAPEVFVMLSENGVLHQKDATPAEQQQNEILQKVVLPLIRGYVRIEGSKIDARDFFTSDTPGGDKGPNPREKLARDLLEKMQPICKKDGILIEQITLAQPESTAELADLVQQIADRKAAVTERKTNEQKVEELKTELERKVAEAMKPRETALGEARKKLAEAEERAKQDKQVAALELDKELKAAQLRLDAAKKEAEAKLTRGKADADVIDRQNEAELAGLRKAVQGFPSPEHYAQYQMMSKLAPALAEIFASDTSEWARLFASYMTAPPNKAAAARGNEKGTEGGPTPMK
jgi:regulator of protease activity HflC (stomatin/prohibitin superfamily)